jgi:hypothetical protein
MPHRAFRRVASSHPLNLVAVVVGLVIVTAGVLKVYQTAEQAHHAICALRQERIEGVQGSREFLRLHPEGIPGISRADILRSIKQQQETVRAFRFADC